MPHYFHKQVHTVITSETHKNSPKYLYKIIILPVIEKKIQRISVGYVA